MKLSNVKMLAVILMHTLVQAADQGPTSYFRLWAAVVESLPTPFQWRLWTLFCYLLFWRHI